MTIDEILNMPAGREMDALVAEKVMGWMPKNNLYWKDNEGSFAGWATNYPEYEVKPFNPSIDIAAAWDVVVKMARTTNVNLAWINSAKGWLWNFKIGRTWASSDTAPLAICRASLLAVMESEE